MSFQVDPRAVGPNLNLLASGSPTSTQATLDDHVATAREAAAAAGYEVEHLQSNHEGALVRRHPRRPGRRGHRLHPGAFTHYAHALAAALAAYDGVVVESTCPTPPPARRGGTLGDRPGPPPAQSPGSAAPGYRSRRSRLSSWGHRIMNVRAARPRRDWPQSTAPRRSSPRPASTPCSSPAWSTSATDRGSPAPPASPGRPRRGALRQRTAATRTSRRTSWPRPESGRIEISGTEQNKIVHDAAAAKRLPAGRPRGPRRHLVAAAQLRLRMVRSAELVPPKP